MTPPQGADNSGPPATPGELYRRFDRPTRKRFGQHFILDPAILEEIATVADIRSDDRVLEIGPGCGTLTLILLQRGAQVDALEIDRDAVAFLRRHLEPHFPLSIHDGDALVVDLASILETTPLPWKVVANLPYNVGTRILFRLFEYDDHIEEMTLMFQREVADRIVARRGDSEFGALSLMSQLHGEVHRAMTLPPGAFVPPPKVDSAVVQFRLVAGTRIADDEVRRAFVRIVEAAFQMRRKTLANGLKAMGCDKSLVEQKLESLGLRPKVRPQRVGFDEFAELAAALLEEGEVEV